MVNSPTMRRASSGAVKIRAPRTRARRQTARARAWVGISGYDYKPWRGGFYPAELPAKQWLWFASRAFPSIEINGTFYSLKAPEVFRRWREQVPARGFVFAIKGGRFITHNLKLRNCETALGNFFAQGVLALGRATGPFLWQLPDSYRFDAERIDGFLRMLPRDSTEGEAVARRDAPPPHARVRSPES